MSRIAAPNLFEAGILIEEGRLRADRAEFITGNRIINNGELEFFADAGLPASSFIGTVTGEGDLLKTGGGIVNISINATGFPEGFRGQTRVENGILATSGDYIASQSRLTVVRGAALVFRDTAVARFARLDGEGVIRGERPFGQTELQIGIDGNHASFSGAIDGRVTLIKSLNNNQSLSGTNSFSGETVVRGGSLSLTGGQSLSDSHLVTVEDGRLVFSAGETVGALNGATFSGDISIAGRLTLAGVGDGVARYNGDLDGSGFLIVDGATQAFGGTLSFQRSTTVMSGHLLLFGQSQSDTTVMEGARLTANNIIDASVINSGIMDVSGGVNRLRIGGDFTQTSSGALTLVLRPTTGDQIQVSGQADIGGALNVALTIDQNYTIGTEWTLIDAAGGLDVSANITLPEIGTFVSLQRSLTDTQLSVALTRTSYASAAVTAPQTAIASALQSSLSDTNRSAAATSALNTLESGSLDDATQFLSALSGETGGAGVSMGRTITSVLQGNVLLQARELAASLAQGWRVWGDVGALFGVETALSGAGGQRVDLQTLSAGAGRSVGSNGWVGASLGYGRVAPDAAALDAFSVNLLAAWDWDAFQLSTVLGYTTFDNDAAQGEGGSLTLQAELSAPMDVGGLQIRPHFGARYSRISLDDVNDQIGTLSAVTQDRVSKPLELHAGIDAAATLQLGGKMVRPFVRAAYIGLLSGRSDGFVRTVDGLGAFSLEGARYGRHGADLAAGARTQLTDTISVSLEYQGRLRQDRLANGVSLRAQAQF